MMDDYLLIWDDGTIESRTDSNPPPHDLRHGVQDGVLEVIRYTLGEYQHLTSDGRWERV